MAAQFAVDILFKAQTQALDKVGQQLGRTERAAEKLNGALRDSKGRFISAGDGAGRAANDIKNFGGAADRAARSAKGLQSSLGGLIGALGLGLAVGKVVSDFRELDTSIRRLATAGGDVSGLDAGLRKVSDQLGGVYSKAELAKGAYQALSAGFSDTADALSIVAAASKAAYGGLADQEEVTSVLVKTLNSYGLSANKASQVTDIISKSIEVGNVEWSDYTSQLGKVSGMAAVAGVSFQDLNAFIAAATKNGATAEQAFTGLSGLLTGLLQPTKESADAAAALGVEWNLSGLKAKGLSGLLGDLSKAQEKDAETAARMVGNTEAVRGAFAAAANGGKTYTTVLDQLGGAAGKTDQDFVTMSASIDAKLRGLSTAFQNAGEAFVKAFGPAIQFVITKLTELLGWMEQVFGRMNDLMNNGGRNTQAELQARPQAVRELRKKYGVFAELTNGDKLPALVEKYKGEWLKNNPVAAAAAPTAPKMGGSIPMLMPNAKSGINPAIQALADSNSKSGSTKKAPASLGAQIAKSLQGALNITDAQAAGIVGNFMRESGLNPRINEGGAVGAPRGVGGYGLAQWTGSRQQDLIRFAGGASQAGDMNTQLRFVVKELLGSESNALAKLRQAQSPEQAAVVFDQYYERSGVKALGQRQAGARSVFNELAGGPGGGLEDYANLLEEQLKQEETRAKQLKDAQGIVAASQNELAIAQAIGEQDRLRLEAAEAKRQIEAEYADKIEKSASEEETALLNKAKGIELKLTELQLEQQLTELKQGALSSIQEENAALEARLAGKEKEYELQRQINDLVKAGGGTVSVADATALVQRNQQLKNANSALDTQKQLWADIYSTVTGQLQGSIQGLIDGTKEWKDVLSELLSSVGNLLLNAAFAGLGKSLGFPGFASGGSTPVNTPVLVGERGPEMFVPGQSGGITNAQNLRSMMNSQGSKGSSNGAQVNMNMSFQTTRFMDRDWVDQEQLQAAMAQATKKGAERGEQRALDKLRQSPRNRRAIGL